ncbi:hypothetical protein BDL97_18G010500 [Sphagnum fallax]|nr:hypothetical protein BDL97_18G010500 [Sphagnum fallax]
MSSSYDGDSTTTNTTVHQVLEGLQNSQGNKEIPFSLLYDKKGSELYEEKTKLEEYYPFLAEDHMLELYVDEIAAQIPLHSVIVELGCGTAPKTAKILSAIQACHGRCRYVGIDVSGPFLEEAYKNLMQNVDGLQHEDMDMVQADYMEGLKIVREHYPHENVCILWLGSRVGNLSASAAVQFFRDAVAAVGTHCQILLCADMWKDQECLRAAYYDKVGVTGLFMKNGMHNALALLGHEVATKDEESWVYEVDINKHLHQFEMYLKFPADLQLPNTEFTSGERVLVEVSRKFTVGDFNHLANESGFVIDMAWHNQTWGMQMLIPFKEAYVRCWHATDAFFRNLPDWSMKPIDVRHPFCFYYGHLPAFAELKLLPNEVPTKLIGTTTKKKLSAAALKSSIYSSGNNMVPISKGNAMMGGNVAAEFHMVQISNRNVMMGGNVADNSFMWDNECPQFTTHVSEKFLVSSEPVSVRDFLTFVKEGGYQKEEFWQPLDFKFFKDQGHKHPATWSKVMESIMCILWIQLIIGPKLQISLFLSVCQSQKHFVTLWAAAS